MIHTRSFVASQLERDVHLHAVTSRRAETPAFHFVLDALSEARVGAASDRGDNAAIAADRRDDRHVCRSEVAVQVPASVANRLVLRRNDLLYVPRAERSRIDESPDALDVSRSIGTITRDDLSFF